MSVGTKRLVFLLLILTFCMSSNGAGLDHVAQERPNVKFVQDTSWANWCFPGLSYLWRGPAILLKNYVCAKLVYYDGDGVQNEHDTNVQSRFMAFPSPFRHPKTTMYTSPPTFISGN